ncbi:MAG TPA: tRNA preQ1(34) S-adenosylmethionine ribosyltransferase-isomerase QueA [Burkholderiales bacterium]|nr:tRNA preQ1(34) S-adenosylmethionine ribosyltransferase-isomerase QueA [Burkholderiales bacterium]
MRVSEFDYELPVELIAQHPAPSRSASRLLHLAAGGRLEDLMFTDLPQLVDERDTLVLNDTRVIKARLFGRKPSGGQVEVLVERIVAPRIALALLRAGHVPKPGTQVLIGEVQASVEERAGELYRVSFSQDVERVLERHGTVPLPPYITHPAQAQDAERYQTVYAERPGAVAAPTAGLHFDSRLLERLRERGARIATLTLHVGFGTFQPLRTDIVEAHRMHRERYSIPDETLQAIAGRRVLAVGTTSLRALEAAAATGETSGETDLFIYPGYEFQVVDRLLTNFHLPKSTLLMLVCAFAGRDNVLRAYRHAIEQRYRFFSYGDAMLIER